MIDKIWSLLCWWNTDARFGSRVRTISSVDGFYNVIDDGFIRVNNSLRVLNLINKALRRIPTSGLCDMHSRRLQNPFKDLSHWLLLIPCNLLTIVCITSLQAGWKETHLQFATQLKNLTAQGVTEIGPALKNAFDMLNMNRNQSGIDTYGQVNTCLLF